MNRVSTAGTGNVTLVKDVRPSLLARLFVVAWLVVMWPVTGSAADEGNTAQQEVFAAEREFARSMADRSLERFAQLRRGRCDLFRLEGHATWQSRGCRRLVGVL